MRLCPIKACALLACIIITNLQLSESDNALTWRDASAQRSKQGRSKQGVPTQASTVRYSYEKQTQGRESGYVLIPIIERMGTGAYNVFDQRQRALFNAVKSSKSASYGSTRFAVKGKTIYVFIDPKKIKNARFIMAETIYTFIANGAEAVRFPKSKFSGRDYKRSDVNLPVYQLTLPYWEGLPPQQTTAILSLGDGSFLSSASLQAQLKRGVPELIAQLNETLKSGNLSAVTAIVNANDVTQIKGIEEGLISLLQSANTKLRLEAIRGLVKRGTKEVYRALKAVVNDDPSDEVKSAAAQELSRAKDPKVSVVAIFYQLRSPKSEIVIEAIGRLVKMKRNKEVNKELIKTLKHPDRSARNAALDALIKRKALKELSAQLNGELTIEVKIQIAERLIKQKSARKSALDFLVAQPNAEAATRALETLRGAKVGRAEGAWFSRALRHPDASVRIKASEILGESKDKKVLKILASGDINDKESGEQLHAAMRAVYNRQKDKVVLNSAARESKVSLKSAATGTLGSLYARARNARNKSRIIKAIGQLTQSPKEWVRAEAIRSLGDLGTPEALADIMKLSGDQSLRVRWAVARVLKLFAVSEVRAQLEKYLKSKNVRLLKTTLDSLNHLKAVDSFSVIFTETFLKHPDAGVRRATLRAVVTLIALIPDEKRSQYTTNIYLVLDADADIETRVLAARALGSISDQNSRDFLSGAAGAQDTSLAQEIIDALLAHKNPLSVKALENSADHKSSEVRAYLYKRLKELKGSKLGASAKSILQYSLKRESNDQLKSQVASALKTW